MFYEIMCNTREKLQNTNVPVELFVYDELAAVWLSNELSIVFDFNADIRQSRVVAR